MIAVITEQAKLPVADMALISAWIPAPPPLSEPAMVKTIGVFVRIVSSAECCCVEDFGVEAFGVKSFEIELCVIVAPTILQDVGERTLIEGEVALGS